MSVCCLKKTKQVSPTLHERRPNEPIGCVDPPGPHLAAPGVRLRIHGLSRCFWVVFLDRSNPAFFGAPCGSALLAFMECSSGIRNQSTEKVILLPERQARSRRLQRPARDVHFLPRSTGATDVSPTLTAFRLSGSSSGVLVPVAVGLSDGKRVAEPGNLSTKGATGHAGAQVRSKWSRVFARHTKYSLILLSRPALVWEASSWGMFFFRLLPLAIKALRGKICT